MRSFNVAGPCLPDRHYMLPPEPRLPDAREYIADGYYFVVHAPRQSGKTTTLLALARTLASEGEYVALHLSCEAASAAGDDYEEAQRAILGSLRLSADAAGLPPELMPPNPWPDAPDGLLLRTGLTGWSRQCPKPLVLFFDEIDSLAGQSLISVLRQLRDGYNSRPAPFPHSVALCGMRDVRDYKLASGGDGGRLTGPSPFNIKIDSIRLGDFTAEEVGALYAQHTADTGQPFTGEAVERAYAYTRGQPWLVNALAREITRRMRVDPPTPIESRHVDEAKERLILARVTHLDSLAARLAEPRVRNVIEPLIAGELGIADETYDDDVSYLRDLGLLTPGGFTEIANPIYREVILRVLGARVENRIPAEPKSFVLPDGRLDFRRLLEQFADFWAQNAEVLIKGSVYHEVAPQLVMMAFVHRVVNGGGQVSREFGLGYNRIDMLIRWPYLDEHGRRQWQQEAVELKLWRPNAQDPTPDGLTQLDGYLDRLRLDTGTLIVFDRRPPRKTRPLPERIAFNTGRTPSGRTVTLLRA